MSKSILSWLTRPSSNTSNESTSDPVHSVNKELVNSEDTVNENELINNVDNEDAATSNASVNSVNGTSPHISQYHHDKKIQFPKSTIGKRERCCCCQHQWFEDFKWLHYDIKKRLCFVTHFDKLTAEHNKDVTYISVGFLNWKKAPKCFEEYVQSKCHNAPLTYEAVVSKCCDPVEMPNAEIVKKRNDERQYLKVIMEALQYLGRQGIAGSDEDGNDNFTQLMRLRGKDHPYIVERMTSNNPGSKRYTHHDFQDELLNIMPKQLLRKKLYDVNDRNMYSLMCDEYTVVSTNSNSRCV